MSHDHSYDAHDIGTGTILPAGTTAPDFNLPSSTGGTASLSRYRGRPVILAFYPGDWTPVCTSQLALYNQVLPMFKEHDAQIFSISVDSVWSHKAWAETQNLHFPLLADFEPKGLTCRAYGAYLGDKGTASRALFVIDAQGVIAWSYLSPIDVNPGAEGILAALEGLKGQTATAG